MKNPSLENMLARYKCNSLDDYKNALHEVVQEIALLGLWRAKFFEHAAFYGGTALRILYGLDRFSEDLDFSLLSPMKNFDLSTYNQAVQSELASFGFQASVEKKEKTITTAVQSAFIKLGAASQLLHIEAPRSMLSFLPRDQIIKIRMEVDTNPPGNFETETQYLLEPIPFGINTYTLPHLFAGKMHAILCRAWKNRVKGRDWYDLVWYIGKKVPVNLTHLQARLIQTGHLKATDTFNEDILHQMLHERIQQVDFESAKKDVQPFLRDQAAIAVWSPNFFTSILGKLKVV
jgi:predicted nucleotidyltransferase component of viral defense system